MHALIFMCIVGGTFAMDDHVLHHKELSYDAVYKENLGEVHFIDKYWHIINKIDLRTYKENIQYAQNLDLELHNICKTLENYNCENLIKTITAILQKIENKEIIFENLFPQERSKRSLFDGVGETLNVLFGTMSQSDAVKYNKYMEDSSKKVDGIIHVTNEHTSILTDLINTGNEIDVRNQNSLKELDKQIQDLNNQINQNYYRLDKIQQFESIFQMAILCITGLEDEQNVLTSILDSAMRGQVHYLLIRPNQMKQIISNIMETKHFALPLPTNHVDIISFYNHLEVSVCFSNGSLLFEVNMPLINIKSQKLVKLTTIPTKTKNNEYIYIHINKNILIIDNDKQRYSIISSAELEKCKQYGFEYFICKNKPISFSLGQQNCEISLFFNNIPNTKCNNIQKLTIEHTLWFQTENINKYIYTSPKNTNIMLICENETQQIRLFGQGCLEIQSKCIINCEDTFIYFNTFKQLHGTDLHTNMAKLNISNAVFTTIHTNTTHIQKTMLINKDSNLFKELNTQIKHLDYIPISEKISIHDKIHYGGLMTLAIIVIGGMIVWFIFTQNKKKEKIVPQPNMQQITGEQSIEEPRSCFDFNI